MGPSNNLVTASTTVGLDLKSLLVVFSLALLSSVVLASGLTSWLNNVFLSRREDKERRRKAIGLLQRARSSATMYAQKAENAKYSSGTRVSGSFKVLRQLMLSPDFTTATAELNLDDAYRALEKLHAASWDLDDWSLRRERLAEQPNSWTLLENEELNPNVDPGLFAEREAAEKRLERAIRSGTEASGQFIASIASQQEKLRRGKL
jgi:hypothetical protein